MMEGNLHSVAGETVHQTRPDDGRFHARKDKMQTSQTGGHLAHRRRQNTWEARQRAALSGWGEGGQNA